LFNNPLVVITGAVEQSQAVYGLASSLMLLMMTFGLLNGFYSIFKLDTKGQLNWWGTFTADSIDLCWRK